MYKSPLNGTIFRPWLFLLTPHRKFFCRRPCLHSLDHSKFYIITVFHHLLCSWDLNISAVQFTICWKTIISKRIVNKPSYNIHTESLTSTNSSTQCSLRWKWAKERQPSDTLLSLFSLYLLLQHSATYHITQLIMQRTELKHRYAIS